ncbi:CHASE2 domain-containing protein [Sphingobium sufflavum]|uniref:CHASE2 domain-containing protein n=1 Tax=Sphingobium sufflavum TaxID=1129547 RepID=UPI001F27E301|nr:CHASE2 domain-containing protein [Sphingobium sufflavum]MCE7797208.1 CHASE2 domain-containing protein [Sphingobium sufflavum]
MLYRRLVTEWALVSLCATLIVLGASRGGWMERVDTILLDAVIALSPPPVDERILLVEIDDASLARVGRWPWPRARHAAALDILARARPLAIGYDVLFLEGTAEDAVLGAAISRATPVVLPMLPPLLSTGQEPPGEGLPPPVIMRAAAALGSVDVDADGDGVVRSYQPGHGGSIPLMVERIAALVTTVSTPTARDGERLLIPFEPPGSFRRIAFADLLSGSVPSAFLRGRIVMVGGTAAGFGDRFLVPSSAGTLMSGVELQANILNGLVQHHFYRRMPDPWQTVLALLPVWLLLLAFLRFGPSTNLKLSLVALGGTAALALGGVLVSGWWFAPGATLLGLVLVYSLWGWRRLAAVSDFLAAEARALQAEPDIMPATVPADARGDLVNMESGRLHDVIGQMRALRHYIADILARLPDAVCVVDDDGRVVMGNIAADALFDGPVRGRMMADILVGRGMGAPEPGAEIGLDDGRTLVMMRAPIGGAGTIQRFVDISELKRAGEAREQALQFLSHDMRAPHAAIIALLEGGGAGPDALRGHAERGLKLADDFVQLARVQQAVVQREPVDLADVGVEAIDRIWPLAKRRGVTIAEEGLDADLWVMGDRGLLVRAVVNLLDNGVKFAPEGGCVACALGEEEGRLRLSVSGPGPAMPPERAADPFVAFAPGQATGDRDSGGLGLAFVRIALERQRGTVDYAALPGGVHRFSILLSRAFFDEEGE